MWRTPADDRVLTPGEWALVRAGLARAWDAVEAARDTPGGAGPTGVRAFDALQYGQQVGLLAQVGRALSDPGVPAPPLTAVTEGAVAAIFAVLRAGLDLELTAAGLPTFDPTGVRRLLLAAVGNAHGQDDPRPAVTDPERHEWDLLLEEVEGRLFWDADWEMADQFLDLPPEEAHELLDLHGIDPDYFKAVPDDLEEEGLDAARREMARLTGRTAPDGSGP
jgi:hypothetical protein